MLVRIVYLSRGKNENNYWWLVLAFLLFNCQKRIVFTLIILSFSQFNFLLQRVLDAVMPMPIQCTQTHFGWLKWVWISFVWLVRQNFMTSLFLWPANVCVRAKKPFLYFLSIISGAMAIWSSIVHKLGLFRNHTHTLWFGLSVFYLSGCVLCILCSSSPDPFLNSLLFNGRQMSCDAWRIMLSQRRMNLNLLGN